MTFRVLHVCTGNICRSPLAEHLMRVGLQERLGAEADQFVVESAGTWGHSGSPMEPFALTTLKGFGLDGSAFEARELVAEHVVAADLVLTATREHRAAAVVLLPRAAKRTFTLREFDRLLSLVDPASLPTGDRVGRAEALVQAAAAQRGLIRPDRPEDDDLVDPYQGPESGFTACGALVHQTLQRPLDLLARLSVEIRDARDEDWEQIWPFLREICAAGEVLTYPRDQTEEQARALWMKQPPGRTVVAVDGDLVLGTAEMHPNQAGPGAHVANASFLVDPAHGRRGIGRALGEHVLERTKQDGYRALQFNAVVETNTHAVRLWQSLGLQIVGTVPEAFEHPRHGFVGLLVMHRRL